ncbi:MAG: site-specific integrase [Syntrophobacteraceae bacterium]
MRAKKEEEPIPTCPKCGAEREYSKKWNISAWMLDKGKKREVVKAISIKFKTAVREQRKLEAQSRRGEQFISSRKPIYTFEIAVKDFLEECRMKIIEGNLAQSTYEMYRERLQALSRAFAGCDVLAISEEAMDAYKRDRILNGRVFVRKRVRGYNPKSTYALGKTCFKGGKIYRCQTTIRTPERWTPAHWIEVPDGNRLELVQVRPLKPASVNRELATLKSMFSVLKRMKKIRENPAANVRMLKENNRRERCLTQEEIDRLLAQCSPNWRLLVLIALNTGLRKSGCLTLKWEEINFERNEIVKRNGIKGGKKVRIPLTSQLRSVLLENPGVSGYVVKSPGRNDRPTTLKDDKPYGVSSRTGYKGALRRAGISDFTFHDLRHTFATWFISTTRDIHTLAQILGHSTTYTTERYSHLLNDHAQAQMKAFGDSMIPKQLDNSTSKE